MSTTYMLLDLPTPGADEGTWDDELNAALTDVDAHDHTSAKGKPVPTAGLDINADLDFNSNALDAVSTVRLDDQADVLETSDDIRNVYVVDGDLYYNNGSGIPIQMTDGNNIATPPPTVPDAYQQFTFALDGPYYVANDSTFPAIDQGARFIAPFDLVITDVYIQSKTQGSSGTTEIDLKKSTSASGTWTSIFATTPKVTSTASGAAWVSTSTTATGYTAPQLTVLAAGMTEGQALRLDIVSAMSGTPSDVYVTIVFTTN